MDQDMHTYREKETQKQRQREKNLHLFITHTHKHVNTTLKVFSLLYGKLMVSPRLRSQTSLFLVMGNSSSYSKQLPDFC
jgi:hypothetical protein